MGGTSSSAGAPSTVTGSSLLLWSRQIYRRRVPRIWIVALALVAACVLSTPPSHAADVHGDDEADRYVGTGGLLLPSTVASGTRAEVAGCQGCEWRLSSVCVASDAGNPFSGTPVCLSVVRGCPDMAQLLRAWFRPPSAAWREIGLVCIGKAGPQTVETLGRRVHDWLAREVPAQHGAFQPARGEVTQLPVVFDSGQQAGDLRLAFDVAGASVSLTASPRWHWDFGDGASVATDDPGGRYPHLAVAHVYRVAGDYRAQVETRWSARFTVDGLGPFAVSDPVRQSAIMRVSIGEGRAVLAAR